MDDRRRGRQLIATAIVIAGVLMTLALTYLDDADNHRRCEELSNQPGPVAPETRADYWAMRCEILLDQG